MIGTTALAVTSRLPGGSTMETWGIWSAIESTLNRTISGNWLRKPSWSRRSKPNEPEERTTNLVRRRWPSLIIGEGASPSSGSVAAEALGLSSLVTVLDVLGSSQGAAPSRLRLAVASGLLALASISTTVPLTTFSMPNSEPASSLPALGSRIDSGSPVYAGGVSLTRALVRLGGGTTTTPWSGIESSPAATVNRNER